MAHHGHNHNEAKDNYFLAPEAWTKVRNGLALIALLSWAGMAAGFLTDRPQFHFSYLVSFAYFVSLTLGAMFYVMVQHLTGSAWSVTVRRLMETIMRTIPIGLVLFVPVALGTHYMYEWTHATAATDPILVKKIGFLNEQWFLIRSFVVLGLWSLFAWRLYALSRKQDDTGSLQQTSSLEKWSAPGLLMLFLTASLAAFDWVMSLDPHWWSTMFGVYFLAGGALSFIAALIAICLALRSAGYLTNSIKEEHYHDLGKWLFALTVFWAYVTFSQYMLIWYGNLPEENVWYQRRLVGSWSAFRPILIFCHFAIPFFTLMPRASKRNLKVLGFFAGWMMLMHYVDLYWQIMPVLHAKGVAISWMDPVAFLAVGSTYGLVFWAGLRQKPLVPVGDPRLDQCLAFHNV
jgi:hypothetical protein